MKDDKIPDLELEDNCKVKLKVKPKIDFNLNAKEIPFL